MSFCTNAARFRSTSEEADVRTSALTVQSSLQMTCIVPDYPRGSVVRIEVSMNGVEFFPFPHELRLYQLPRLTNLVPNWISSNFTTPLVLQGVNLAAAGIAATPNSVPLVHISMVRGHLMKTLSAPCVDGEVHCLLPRDLLSQATESSHSSEQLILEPSIMVDIRLGGARKSVRSLYL